MRHGVVSSVVCQNRRRPRESLFQSHTIEELTAVVVEGNLSTKFREKVRQICFAATAIFAVSLCRLLSNLFDILLISRKVSQNHG